MRRREAAERAMHSLFFLCGMATILAVAVITGYLVVSGIPAIREIGLKAFLLGSAWNSTAAEPQFGILPFWLTSVCGTLGAVALGVPVGLLVAIGLAKLAPPRLAAGLRTVVELLAGIPSVVYGLVGSIVLVPAIQRAFGLNSGACLLAAILVLAIMVLPSIISVSETALRAVPRAYEEGSLALGATEMETMWKVSVPAAGSGIAAGVVLGVGRAMGEAMAVLMVAGNVAQLPGLFRPVTFLTTAIAKELSYAAGLQRQALFSIALVLFFLILLINILLHGLLKRGRQS